MRCDWKGDEQPCSACVRNHQKCKAPEAVKRRGVAIAPMRERDRPAAPKAARHEAVAQGSILNDEELEERSRESKECKPHSRPLLPDDMPAAPPVDLTRLGAVFSVNEAVSCNLDSWSTFFAPLTLSLTWLLLDKHGNARQTMARIVGDIALMTASLPRGSPRRILFAAYRGNEHGMFKVGRTSSSAAKRETAAALAKALFGMKHPPPLSPESKEQRKGRAEAHSLHREVMQLFPKLPQQLKGELQHLLLELMVDVLRGWPDREWLGDVEVWRVSCEDRHFLTGAFRQHLTVGNDADIALVGQQLAQDDAGHFWCSWLHVPRQSRLWRAGSRAAT
jgi:hypothetical protein